MERRTLAHSWHQDFFRTFASTFACTFNQLVVYHSLIGVINMWNNLALPGNWPCYVKNHRSQYGEDAVLLQLVWLLSFGRGSPGTAPSQVLPHRPCATVAGGDPSCGMFLELGALDGLQISNTLVFDRCLGWKGILLEGNSENAQNLARNRPGNFVKQVAVSPSCGEHGTVDITRKGGGASGLVRHMGAHFLREFHTNSQYSKKNTSTESVPCRQLQDVLDEALVSHLPIFSLDVEGAELQVRMKTISLPVDGNR